MEQTSTSDHSLTHKSALANSATPAKLDPAAAEAANGSPRPYESDEVAEERRISLLDRVKFEFVRKFLWAWASLFSLRGLYLLGVWFGTLEYAINFKRRRRYRGELRRVFPEGIANEESIVRAYFCRTRCDKLFYLIFDRLPKEKILKRIKFHGREHVDRALARGNGIYVMLSHAGSHHVAAQLMAFLGYKVTGVRDRNEGPLRRYVQEKFTRTFPEVAERLRMLYADAYPRKIFRCFQDNHVVGTALDVGRMRDKRLKTCPVQIFGETREFLIGTVQVALRCGATICPAFVVSRPNFYFRIIVRPPLIEPDGPIQHEDPEQIREVMQAYADGLAVHIRENPDHLSRA